jgi:hypothetical protein
VEEKNMKKLWLLCELIKDYCESHNNCNYCPFYDNWDGCKIKDEAGVDTDELWKLFPEHITSDEGGD